MIFMTEKAGPFKKKFSEFGLFYCAAVFAWTLGGESFVPVKAAGGLLIVSGMLAGELSKIRRVAEPESVKA
ncbi:MAG: hypothetical protein WCW52_02165 [Elusimicrobiales bacterium]|jgi:drug/metabolite transporter (DMT)-like permease